MKQTPRWLANSSFPICASDQEENVCIFFDFYEKNCIDELCGLGFVSFFSISSLFPSQMFCRVLYRARDSSSDDAST